MATVEELVIELITRVDNAEQKLEKIDSELKKVEKDSSSAKKGMEELSKASERTATSGEKAGRGARKAGDEIERAGKKAHSSSILLDKAQARLSKGWIKALSGYMIGLVAAGSVIGFIKESIAKTLESATAIGKVAEASGQSREEVHALGKAFESLGKSQESAYKYLKDFQDGKYDKAAAQIGIKTQDKGQRRSGQDVLVEMGRKAVEDSGGDKDLAAKRLQAIGLEKEAAEAAVKATKDLIDEKRKSNLVSEEQIETAERVASRFNDFGNVVKDLAEAFGYALMPMIEGVLDIFDGVMDALKGLYDGFMEAAEGTVSFGGILEVIFAPVTILKELIDLLVGSLEGLSGWTQVGGQMVFQFFNIARTVWNAVIGVINGVIGAIESMINALDNLGAAVANLTGGSYTPTGIKLGRIGEIGKGGSSKAPAWNANPGRGAVRGSWGMPGAGGVRGGGRSGGGRGRRGGSGRGGASGATSAKDAEWHSFMLGSVDYRKLGISPVVARIPEDPAKKAAEEERRNKRKGVSSKIGEVMRPVVGAVHSVKEKSDVSNLPLPSMYGSQQAMSAGRVTNIYYTNTVTVNAPGNTNARQIADRTSNAMQTIARRQAGAMAA